MKKILTMLFCLMMLVGCQASKPEVKDFVNKPYEEALAYCEENKIPFITSYTFNDEVEKEYVISQEIMTEGYEEETVLFVVSNGHEPFMVNDLTGYTEEKLKEEMVKLEEKYFYYDGRIEYIENCADETGIVISQSPADEAFDEPVEVVYLVSKKSENCPVEEAPVTKPTKPVQKPAAPKPSTDDSSNNSNSTSTTPTPEPTPTPKPTPEPTPEPEPAPIPEPKPQPEPTPTPEPELPPVVVEPIPDEDEAHFGGEGSIDITIPVPTEEDLKNAPDRPEGTVVWG